VVRRKKEEELKKQFEGIKTK